MHTLECPICRRSVPYQTAAEIPFRPFCSRRCQMIDLGKWLNEDYRVSEVLPIEMSNEKSSTPSDPDLDD